MVLSSFLAGANERKEGRSHLFSNRLHNDMAIMKEEIFGPVLPIIT